MGKKMLAALLVLTSLVLLLSNQRVHAEDLPDFEKCIQEYVLETKRIEIPGFPTAFNASIVRWNGSLLISFRIIPNPADSFTSYVGIAWLDDDFNVIGEPQILDFRGKHFLAPSRAEDARLIVVDDRLLIVYDDNTDMVITRGGFRVFIAELVLDGSDFSLRNIERLSKYKGESANRREKAWVPFDYCGNLLLAYSINPHLIFYPMVGTGECATLALTEPQLEWLWGEIRGGTCALRIDDERYLSFFHSSMFMSTVHSKGKNMTHYFMAAYTFSAEPPFAITHMSPEPIFGHQFYTGPVYKYYWKPIRAVFPCGFILEDPYIWISYGRDDYEIWVVKIDKEGLLQSLQPVGK